MYVWIMAPKLAGTAQTEIPIPAVVREEPSSSSSRAKDDEELAEVQACHLFAGIPAVAHLTCLYFAETRSNVQRT